MIIDFLYGDVLDYDGHYITVLVNKCWGYRWEWYSDQKTKLQVNQPLYIFRWVFKLEEYIFAFADKYDRDFFALLISAPGVGVKTLKHLLTQSSLKTIAHKILYLNVQWFSEQKIPYFTINKIEDFVLYVYTKKFKPNITKYNQNIIDQLKQLGYRLSEIILAMNKVVYSGNLKNYVANILQYIANLPPGRG